ncbi:MAG TPA: hydroxysqualene dehydroxylase HpnE [Caulobacteraceae bacterium]
MDGAAGAVGAVPTVHVIGAGLAGLSGAVALASKGVRVELVEAAMQAGGRCRSYFDPLLDMTIDNGNHLVLSGNHATFDYLRTLGSADRLTGPDEAVFPFVDVRDGRRWTVRPNPGPLPWWLLDRSRRVPGARLGEYLAAANLVLRRADRRIDETIRCKGPLWERLLAPLLLAALNTDPRIGSAALAGAVIRETLAKGGRACRPRIARPSLSAAFVDPAIAFLEARGARLRFGERLRGLEMGGRVVLALDLGEGAQTIGPTDAVILATPPWITQQFIAGLVAPDRFSPIVNGHFRTLAPSSAPPMVGVIGGTAEWVFAFADRLSVTASGAEELVDRDRESLARLFWRDVAAVHGLGEPLPPWQIVKERRATFAATPEQNARRPGPVTAWRNLFLAGDWTRTGLPATIEGAIRSGATAADLALKSLGPA